MIPASNPAPRRGWLIPFRRDDRATLTEIRKVAPARPALEALDMIDQFLRRSTLLDAELRGLALRWVERALSGVTRWTVDDRVGGAIDIVREIVTGRLGANHLDLAHWLACEAYQDARRRGEPFLVREAAHAAAMLADPNAGDAAAAVAQSVVAIAAHRRGLERGHYEPANDFGSYSPDWSARPEVVVCLLADIAAVTA